MAVLLHFMPLWLREAFAGTLYFSMAEETKIRKDHAVLFLVTLESNHGFYNKYTCNFLFFKVSKYNIVTLKMSLQV